MPVEVLDVQARGEYLYAAMGKGGFRIFDIANIDNKDISERMVTAPVSPLGQRFYLPTKYATAVATPTTLGVDPLRTHREENEEQAIHLMYGFLYVADKYEGLVIVGDPNLKGKSPGVGTLLDGNPANNFLKRAANLQSRGRAERRPAHHHRRDLRLHPLRSRTGGGRPRPSSAAQDRGRNWRAVSAAAARARHSVPLRIRG